MYKVFIDGSAGTTGLKIYERFRDRPDLEVLTLPEPLRKDLDARMDRVREADASFLCLPDAASRELCRNLPGGVRILDTSTAHRTAPGWVYGLPELSAAQRAAVSSAERVAVPGCHATGFVVLAVPLVALGIAGPDYPFTACSVTGYSGGGKKMISDYTAPDRPKAYDSPRQYGLGQTHKHLPEMQKIPGLTEPPVFSPIVADYFSGMVVTVPIHTRMLQRPMGPEALAEALASYYEGVRFIHVHAGNEVPADGFVDAAALAGTNELEIFVCGTEERVVLLSRFDNLGKGASGAAVQCMNLMLGLPEDAGL